MFDYTLNQPNSSPKSALEVDLRVREQSRRLEMLTAAYRKDARSKARRSNLLKTLLTSFVSRF